MTKQFMRKWQSFDMDDVTKHLVILGDLVGDCASCRELGIDIKQVSQCPQCHTEFKYIASRRVSNHPGERFQITKRIQELRPNWIVIDYDDYQKITGSQKARDFLSGSS